MIVKELIQRADCKTVAQIWNESYRFDQDEPYDERELAQALCVHLELLLNFQPVQTQGILLTDPENTIPDLQEDIHQTKTETIRFLFDQETPWLNTIEEILGLTVWPGSFQNPFEEQAVIAAILHQIFFRNQRGHERQENIA